VPKNESKERFSSMITITCWISWMSPVRLKVSAVLTTDGGAEIAVTCRDDAAQPAVARVAASSGRKASRLS
jgi:NADPH-dependent 7-cyano-7-deazaguanine reductase QueF